MAVSHGMQSDSVDMDKEAPGMATAEQQLELATV